MTNFPVDAPQPAAINERFPAPFEGLDYKTARNLAIDAARHERASGEELTEQIVWQLREDMYGPLCGLCGEVDEPGFHLATCTRNTGRHLRLHTGETTP